MYRAKLTYLIGASQSKTCSPADPASRACARSPARCQVRRWRVVDGWTSGSIAQAQNHPVKERLEINKILGG